MSSICMKCGRNLVRDEVAINLKLVNKNAKEYLCIPCLSEYFKCSEQVIWDRIEALRESGCTLFPMNSVKETEPKGKGEQSPTMVNEAKKHLTEKILPFWENLIDKEYGGYYGYLDYDLKLDQKYVKGCILNSRILWFFSNAAMTLQDTAVLSYADHAYDFMTGHCLDRKNGGIFWAMNYDGTVSDSTKHTYNQAFAIYALSSYFAASGRSEALQEAEKLFDIIEENCTDEIGYLEAFTADFKPESNEKLSENGVMAEKTMNTLLHVLEAYTELYRVTGSGFIGCDSNRLNLNGTFTQLTEDQMSEFSKLHRKVRERLVWILNCFADKVFNPVLRRQEVFFDREMNSIIDLHSYGHDIETAWLVDRCCEVLQADTEGEHTICALAARMSEITKVLTSKIYERAYVKHSLLNECERGVDDKKRIWWVQAEAVVSFLNAYQKDPVMTKYLDASKDIFRFVMDYVVDKRAGSEWFMWVDENGTPITGAPIVEPWKCPYHNGRMCLEIIRRGNELASDL